MNRKLFSFGLIALTLLASFTFSGTLKAAPEPEPNISVVGYFGTDKAQRGRPLQTAIVIDIPNGYHINSNRPLESYLIATQLKVDAPSGVRVGPVSYPRPLLQSFKFSQKKLSVYEKQTRLKFTLAIPANYSGSTIELKTKVRLQSCNDEVCFPPRNYEQTMRINVVNATDKVQRVNGWAFR
jgi:DsbC/DsbD-like thiol-disulfide interchange protein